MTAKKAQPLKKAQKKAPKKGAKAVPKKPKSTKPRGKTPTTNAGQIKPGEVRNPKGRPKKTHSITSQARELVDGGYPMPPAPKGATVAHYIARAWVSDAIDGDQNSRRELLDRLEGKVPEVIEGLQAPQKTPAEALAEFYALEAEKKRILGE